MENCKPEVKTDPIRISWMKISDEFSNLLVHGGYIYFLYVKLNKIPPLTSSDNLRSI